MVWLKVLHVTAISLWAAGLFGIPALYMQRETVRAQAELHRLQALTRFLYVGIASPAAFLGIATGIGLIFIGGTWAPWFAAKLLFVGLLTFVHVAAGLVLLRLFRPGRRFPAWRFAAFSLVTAATVTAILFLVLGKPELPHLLPDAMSEPGYLRGLLAPFNPFQRS